MKFLSYGIQYSDCTDLHFLYLNLQTTDYNVAVDIFRQELQNFKSKYPNYKKYHCQLHLSKLFRPCTEFYYLPYELIFPKEINKNEYL